MLVVGLLPCSAYAFELTELPDQRIPTWPSADFPYSVCFELSDDAGQRLSSASRRAFDSWAYAAQGALRPHYRGPCAEAGPESAGISIRALEAWDPRFGESQRAVAYAWLRYDTASAEVLDADVLLNAEGFRLGDGSGGSFDTQSVVLHELGHVLGLAHSCGLPGRTYASCFSVPDEPPGQRLQILEAVMAPTLSPGTLRRSLGADDLAGLASLWPGSSELRPQIASVNRACPEGLWQIELRASAPAAAEVFIRQANGVWGHRQVRAMGAVLEVLGPEPAPGVFDLVVEDGATGTYDAWVDLSAPAPCAPPEPGEPPVPVVPPEVAGCQCVSDLAPMAGRDGVWAVMVLGLMVWFRDRFRARRGLPAALLVLGLVSPGVAEAFECSRTGGAVGPSLIWQEREVPWFAGPQLFALIEDEAVGESEVMASFAAWEDAECSDLMFPYQGVSNVRAGFDDDGSDTNAVVAISQGWPYQSGAIAVTTTAYDPQNGVVVDADIEFNAVNFRFIKVEEDTMCGQATNIMDLRNTLTHEIGHVLGLEHPPNLARYAESTMFASAPACETKKRTLAADDVEGLCFIYPAAEATQQCYPADGPHFVVVEQDDGFGGCQSITASAGMVWCLVLGLVGLRRRRR